MTEFLACIIFLFVKHPYDVGDRVDIKDVPLVVERISLMYSVFRRIDSDKTVQIPHNIANTLWIENVSRSKPMKEQYNFSISAATTNEDILALRAQLEKFVQAPENKRDFQDDLDIELISLGDLKQLDLRVEIRHKVSTALRISPCKFQKTNNTAVQLLQRKPPPNPPQQIHVRAPARHAQHPHRPARRQRRRRRQLRQPYLQRHSIRHRSSRFPRRPQRRPREQASLPRRNPLLLPRCA